MAGVPHNNAVMYGLPTRIIKDGTVYLTAVIHIRSAAFSIYYDEGGHAKPDRKEWPAESGGRIVL